jgi:hypothetical protein
MYRWFGVVPHGLDVLFPFILFGYFRSFFLAIFWERFRGLSLWDLVGDVCMNPSWFFSLWFPSQICEQRGSILGVFGALGLEVFLVDFFDSSRFSKFWWTKSWLWSAHEVFLLSAKSCTNPWSDSGVREFGSWIWGSWPTGPIHPRAAQPDRSDRCSSPVWPVQRLCGFCLRWTCRWVRCCPVLLLFRVWVSLELGRPVWWIWGFLASTGLTSELHRPDRCSGLLWKFPGFASRDRSDRWCSPA